MRDRWNRAERYFLSVLLPIIALGLAVPCHAQTYTTLVSFNVTNGTEPYYGPLVQGRDGNLWGTTGGGGAYLGGTIFKMTPSGTLTTVYSFCAQANCSDGYYSVAGLLLGKDGNFYGTTLMGGNEGCAYPQGCGVIFKVTPKGVLTVLHTYTAADLGAGPVGGLIQASNGTFYGDGGIDNGGMAVFKVTSAGTYTEIASWVLATAGYPYGGVIQGADGLLYGTTSIGGTGICNDGCGTVFKIQTNGKNMVVLHSFNATDGIEPMAGLVQASDGYFYGVTREGGSSLTTCGNSGYSVCGTLFKISSVGAFTSLYSFCPETGCFDGTNPFGTLIQATDGNLYGTTNQGGNLLGNGTIYQWNPTSQSYSTLYTFVGNNDTAAGLVQATNGKFYGTNFYGGNSPDCPYGCGAIFSFDMGLGPFVRPVTYSGKVGATIEILGQGFNKSTTTVSFNGTAATRTVASGTYLTAKVPTGATTGSITVTTGSTTLVSDKIFTVLQ